MMYKSIAVAALVGAISAKQLKDLPTCIADIEGMIPDVESIIADIKAGNETKALEDLMKLEPEAKKAYADCTSGKKMPKLDKLSLRDLPTCIADIEGMIPDVEKVIADIKAGNEAQALADLMALAPAAQKAYDDCTAGKTKVGVKDLPTCIADIEAMIPDVEAVIADFKAGNKTKALEDMLKLEPEATKAYTDCTSGKKLKNLKDLPTCIADIEAMIPDVEAVIADFKAGNKTKALEDMLKLEPEATKAYTDCTSGIPKGKFLKKMDWIVKKLHKVGDMEQCIQDIEGLIPGVEKVIADVKAGNEAQAMADLMAMAPDAEKAYTDCTSGAKHLKTKIGAMLKDDPKRDYFEKMGAQFASGYFAGTHVGELDEIDLYECLHREPTAVEYFIKADEDLKRAWIHKDPRMAVHSIDEMLGFLGEMVIED